MPFDYLSPVSAPSPTSFYQGPQADGPDAPVSAPSPVAYPNAGALSGLSTNAATAPSSAFSAPSCAGGKCGASGASGTGDKDEAEAHATLEKHKQMEIKLNKAKFRAHILIEASKQPH